MLKNTPWGLTQTCEPTGTNGILSYTTASHGGLHVSKELLSKMDKDVIKAAGRFGDPENGWFEEDCQWAIVAVVFPNNFDEHIYEQSKKIVKSMYPIVYTKYFG